MQRYRRRLLRGGVVLVVDGREHLAGHTCALPRHHAPRLVLGKPLREHRPEGGQLARHLRPEELGEVRLQETRRREAACEAPSGNCHPGKDHDAMSATQGIFQAVFPVCSL